MAPLTLGVFGAFQVTLTNGSIAKFESDKARALLAYLAVESARPHRRDALIGLLWPDEPESTARQNFRQALYSLRQTIRDSSARPPYLLITRDEIQFNPASKFSLDVASFNSHLAATANHSHPRLDACAICAPRLHQAVDLYRGKFLQEFFLEDSAVFEEWAVAQRESLHQRALDALTDLGNYYEQNGDLGATRRCAMRALELDLWHEQAYRQMMRVFALEGQTGAALAQYETCRRVLVEEMGVEPSSETRELFEKIKSGNWNLDIGNWKERPREASNFQPPTSNIQLPTHLTPFIGRERELQDLGRLIADPSCRWITLVGPGGMGKTRLAVQAASNQRNTFAHGVAFVPLVAVESVDAVIPAIAEPLGFSFYGATSPRAQLFNYLRDKQMLLVLDNVEQLANAADLFIELLGHTTAIKLLVTSREPLNAQGEWVFPVEGLQIPQDDWSEAIESSAAVALFVQRAQRTRVGFALSEQDRSIVARLCRLVEGTPLALELAATWIRTLSVKEIVDEIEHNLDFLNTTVRDLPARHRNMRVVFDHSWELLAEEEQKILLRLAVFRGGFRREAAEQVAEATLSSLSSLVSKSLVRRSGENRYDLHELVRQFAADHLSENSDEQSATQDRHSHYYLTLFARAIDRLTSSAQREALAELTIEMDNWRVAWEWACTHNAFALIEQTMRTFVLLYDMRGWWQEGIAMASRAIDALEMARQKSPTDRTTLIALGHILASSAVLTSRLGQYTRAQAMFERSLEILRPLNEPSALVEALTSLGVVMELTGNYARAYELYSEGQEVATAIGDRWFAALCRFIIAGLVGVTQTIVEPEKTHPRLQTALAEWRAIGDPRLITIVLNNLSFSALRLGRYDEARAALEEGVALSQAIGDRWGLGYAYRGLGIIAQMIGEHQQAIEIFRKSLDTLTELGARQDMARILAEMSRSIFALGNDAEAEHNWRESLRLAVETQGTFIVLEALIGVASLQAKRGEGERALELALIVLNHLAIIQETRNQAERLRIELESRLTPQQVEAVRARVQASSFDEIVNQTLGQSG